MGKASGDGVGADREGVVDQTAEVAFGGVKVNQLAVDAGLPTGKVKGPFDDGGGRVDLGAVGASGAVPEVDDNSGSAGDDGVGLLARTDIVIASFFVVPRGIKLVGSGGGEGVGGEPVVGVRNVVTRGGVKKVVVHDQ